MCDRAMQACARQLSSKSESASSRERETRGGRGEEKESMNTGKKLLSAKALNRVKARFFKKVMAGNRRIQMCISCLGPGLNFQLDCHNPEPAAAAKQTD